MLTLYRCLLWLYPATYRQEFGEEMMSVFHHAESALPPALPAKIGFYRRELYGLLSGSLQAHLDRLFGDCPFGSAIPFRRFDMRAQFRFPRSALFLMLVILAGVVLTIRMAASVAGNTVAWQSTVAFWSFVLVFMLLTTCTAAAVVWGVLHTLRRSGVHRLENVQSGIESDGNR